MRWFPAVFLALLLAPAPALGWGESAHYVICEIAYLNLTPAAKAEADRLTTVGGGFASFSQSCLYGDRPLIRAGAHFANYPRSPGEIAGPDCPSAQPCVIAAIMGELATLRSRTSSDGARSEALKLLGHWIGDIHQPLRISFADDRGGNDIAVTGLCPATLTAVWNTCIVERRILAAGPDRYTRARVAAARLNGAITPGQRRAWAGSQPWQWAAESFAIARLPQTGYCVARGPSCRYSETAETYVEGGPKRTQVIDERYLDWATPIAGERMKRAGIRLAEALNRAFDRAYRP